ncbi:unnamed protein product [Coregonus sp. 'balchen']|nr:unnamed protein product [Coregonus sp. 'balchen']
MDSEFGDQCFSLMDTDDIKDKDTVKVFSSGSRDAVILSSPESTSSQRLHPWPSQFEIPGFAYDTEQHAERMEHYSTVRFLTSQDADDNIVREDLAQHVLKVYVVRDGDPEHGICIEGATVLAGIPSVAQAYILLMGLIYCLKVTKGQSQIVP